MRSGWYFFANRLKGEDNGFAKETPKVRYYTMGSNEWSTSASWPPEGIETLTLYLDSQEGANTLSGDGVLAAEPPGSGASSDGFTYDPTAPGNLSASGVSGVVSAFLGAAAIFGGAAVYGYATKRDLTSMGGILFMGLIGLIVVMFVQLFFFSGSSLMNLAIGVIGVIIFTGLTAWDVQKLKNGQMQGINKDSATVVGALMLYLDFINLFLFMLRIFGSSR